MTDTRPPDGRDEGPDGAQPAARRGGRALTEGWLDTAIGFIRGPAGIMAGAMALLALVGTAFTIADVSWARGYWLALVPIYGILCVLAAWWRTGQFTGSVLRQVLHWLSVAAVIALDFALLRRGEQGAAGAGLSSLLILGLGCLLAGIHLDWLFAVVGLLLLAIFAVVSIANAYATVAFLAAATAALVLAAYWAWTRK